MGVQIKTSGQTPNISIINTHTPDVSYNEEIHSRHGNGEKRNNATNTHENVI